MAEGLIDRIKAMRGNEDVPQSEAVESEQSEEDIDMAESENGADLEQDGGSVITPLSSEQAAEIAAYCADNGAAAMAADFIRQNASMETVRDGVNVVSQIRKLVADARVVNPAISASLAETFIKEGKTVEEVSTTLLAKLSGSQSSEIQNTITADAGASPQPVIDHGAIYAKMNGIKE